MVVRRGRQFVPKIQLPFTNRHSLFTPHVELNPLVTLFHVNPRLPNRKLTGKGGIRFQESLNSSVVTRGHAPFATLAHQVLLHNYLALGWKRITNSPVELRIRDGDVTGDAHRSNIDAVENVPILRPLQGADEPLARHSGSRRGG